MKKLNILITAPNLDARRNVSGISAMVNTIIEHNRTHVYRHFLFGRKDAETNRIIPVLHTLKQLILLPRALKKHQTDLVHQNFPFDQKGVLRESVAGLLCRMMRIPVVLHVHGGKFLTGKRPGCFYRLLAKQLFHASHITVVLSDLEKEVMENEYGCTDVRILENCIDCAQFGAEERTSPKTPPVFLFMGRIHESKGMHEMQEVFRRLTDDRLPFRFLLCGDGSLRPSVVEEMGKLMGDRFEYRGVVSGGEKTAAIREADYFLLPSWFEGLPVSLLETMAAGVVPVVTGVGSVEKIVHHGENGVIIEKRNVHDMYEKIKHLLTHPETYATLSQNARRSMLRDYDAGDYVSRLNAIYEDVFP